MKPYCTNRSRAYYRHHRYRVIYRKKAVVELGFWHVKNEEYGRLAKGKIHCSCWMCRVKTRYHGYPKSEQVRIDDCQQQMKGYFDREY